MNSLLASQLRRDDFDWTDFVPWSENRPELFARRSQNGAFVRLADITKEVAKAVPMAVTDAGELLIGPSISLRNAAKMKVALPEDAVSVFMSGSFLLGETLQTFRQQQSYVLGLTWYLPAEPRDTESWPAELPSPYDDRIRELKSYATEEKVDVNAASERAFTQFVRSCSDSGEASVFLPHENGRFTARWVGDRSRLSLEFLGGDAIEYVVLWERHDGTWDGVSREATIDEFWDTYESMEVEHLLRRT